MSDELNSSRGRGIFMVYVDNLPTGVGLPWFHNFFSNFGSVKDAYLPIRRSKCTGNRFGFVRYESIRGRIMPWKKLMDFGL